jgi:peptide/nickel transport system ATP-binding protein
MTQEPILFVENLQLQIEQGGRMHSVLRGVDIAVEPGSIHGLVGESGAGKSMLAKAIVGLLPDSARVSSGKIHFEGQPLLEASARGRRDLLGSSITMIMQNPMTALNPVIRVGKQMNAVLRRHFGLDGASARQRALQALESVHIRNPERVVELYPHELSGGMCQRVLVSLAFACEPRLIVADEPTTALDVTVQRQVLRLLKEMQKKSNVTVLFITHDLGIVAKLCDSATVMFAGRAVETGPVARICRQPQHEYTQALFAATPRYDRPDMSLKPIPPSLRDRLLDEARSYDRVRGHV